MNENILVITDQFREISFTYLNSFYNFKIINLTESDFKTMNEYKLIIIDLNSLKLSITTMNKIRSIIPEKSILIIQDFDSRNAHKIIRKSKGYGQIRIMNYRKEHSEQLVQYINSMLHPQYPVDTSDIAIILPVYNEESRFQNVLNFYKKLEVLSSNNFTNLTVYFVNDGSEDKTQGLIEKIVLDNKQSTEIISNMAFVNSQQLNINTRKAGTYIEGIQKIQADVLVFVDADDSFRIEDIACMINIIREGYYNLVVGTKDLTAENRPPIRRLMSFVKRLMTRLLLPKGIYDSQTGLKSMSGLAARYILPHLHIDTGLAIDLEILHIAKKLNFRTLQFPVKCIDREGSHIDIVKDSIQFIKNIFKIYNRHKNVNQEDLLKVVK